VIALDDYPYEDIDYRGDPDMPFPPGYSYSDIGMKQFSNIFHFFVFFKKNKKNTNIFGLCEVF
jgi:hypothetical protein